jgi:hypothetical protein
MPMTIDFYQLVSIIIECCRLVSVVIQLDVTESLERYRLPSRIFYFYRLLLLVIDLEMTHAHR